VRFADDDLGAVERQVRGKVQCIYLDPPYGIKFNSNFQWSTTSRDVKDGNAGHITRGRCHGNDGALPFDG
jgi:hypothetical protein